MMSSYFIYYTEASIVCVIIFGIMLVWDLFSIDKQEKQIKYDHALIAFMLYFVSDALWAAVIAGMLPRNRFIVVTTNFLNCILMAAITYRWLIYVMAVEQIPKRNKPLTRFVILIPFLLSTAALIFTFLFAPDLLLSSDLELQPLYSVFLVAVPIIYIVAILGYAMKRAIAAESLIERRDHLVVGLFPLLVVFGGLAQVIVMSETPIFCFSSTILMLIFYIGSMKTQISTDPLTGLNNRGQLANYVAQKSNIHHENRLTIVIMLDINDFKLINDTYGHAEGDRALILVSNALKEVVRNHSIPMFLARYGGDEFILVAHPTSESEIDAIICEIRERIEARCRMEGTPYTISIGAGYDKLAGETDTFQKCMQRADEKLYEDKARQKKLRS
ncbi:MAG: GGDEF domain-containing protein [Lachnospiraceae bacterium]|nr:GGDEF domain-containing protein [Lachnospiraceae bacterium]